MTKWMCSECGYQMDGETLPKYCPSCQKDCLFSDVTCYIPECGGEQNINPQVVDALQHQQHEHPKEKL